MQQHKFQIKLASGLMATGFIDILNNVKDAMGIIWTKSIILSAITEDLKSNTGNIVDQTMFNAHVDKVLADPKHKYVLSIHGCKVY